MKSTFNQISRKLLKASIAFCLGISLILIPFVSSAEAARTSMTGDYTKDTISVIHDLKEAISSIPDEENRESTQKETVALITDYISRYRNRSQVNGSISFTTMQTALNALAGHYKTFPKRPVPESLKDRLDSELSKAENIVLDAS